MWRDAVLVGVVAIVMFMLGMLVSANWYETRVFSDGFDRATWERLARDGCEPQSGASGPIFFRCPRLHLP